VDNWNNSLGQILVCPITAAPLVLMSLEAAETMCGNRFEPQPRSLSAAGKESKPIGRTDLILISNDRERAYPIVDGIPILLAPEALTPEADAPIVDLCARQYAEAYLEMEFYSAEATRYATSDSDLHGTPDFVSLSQVPQSAISTFPNPPALWIDAIYDCLSQHDAYSHLLPINGKRVLQLGGKGGSAVKLLVAGAAEAWLITPVLDEARFAIGLATALGVGSRLKCVVAIAEELPLAAESFDAIYVGGSFHHMQPDMVGVSVRRILAPGGRFAAVEPWRSPFYSIGTGVLGKREKNAFCRPLTSLSIDGFRRTFPDVRVVHHGALSRYALLAASKFHIDSTLRRSWKVQSADDRIASLWSPLRDRGSSVVVLASKPL